MGKGANPVSWPWQVDYPLRRAERGPHLSLWQPLRMAVAQEQVYPAYTSTLISTEEPQVTLDVASKKIYFLVDTGATYSVLSSYTRPLSSNSINIMGIEEKSQTYFYTPPVTCQFESLIIPQCPILLL